MAKLVSSAMNRSAWVAASARSSSEGVRGQAFGSLLCFRSMPVSRLTLSRILLMVMTGWPRLRSASISSAVHCTPLR
jgi:hypothetical protein